MNFFLDENFPKIAGKILEAEGHAVFDIRGTEKEGISDIDIFNISKNSSAVFLTTDKDFYHTIHLTSKPHHGIVIIALAQPNADNIILKLKWFLKHISGQKMKDKCFLITDNRCNIYN